MSEARISLLRSQFQGAHQWFEGTMQGVTPELTQWLPPGKAHPIGSQYVHVVTSEDYFVQTVIQGRTPLMATFKSLGFSEPPPIGNREDWARRVQVDLGQVRAYGQAVYAATDAYLAGIADEELDRPLDLTSAGFGLQDVKFLLSILILNVNNHCGEISCLKGLNGLQGYPG